MAREVFIQEWNKKDFDGRRDLSTKSEGTINGEHVYACKNLTTWFRLGKYIIKHDWVNYLLGLTRYMSRDEFRNDVKVWDWNKETNEGKNIYCVDEIVKVVNEHFSGNDFLLTLMLLQDELVGYEQCFLISRLYQIEFDYVQFIKDKDAYKARLLDFVKRVKAMEQFNTPKEG